MNRNRPPALSTEEKGAWLRAYWGTRLGPFFDPTAEPPPRLINLRRFYDDMLFIQVVDEMIKQRNNPQKINPKSLDMS